MSQMTANFKHQGESQQIFASKDENVLPAVEESDSKRVDSPMFKVAATNDFGIRSFTNTSASRLALLCINSDITDSQQ